MTDAINAPVRRAAPEKFSGDTKITQKPDIVVPNDGPLNRTQTIDALETPMSEIEDYAKQLAFNEEPVTVMVHPKQEKNPPIVVDCWVNGKGAEILMNGKWVVFNCLPVGKVVTTKRKYVEVLLRSKTDTINTQHEDANVENPRNVINRSTSSNALLSIIEDKSPLGSAWLSSLMAQPG
jgi:hypothetical protein